MLSLNLKSSAPYHLLSYGTLTGVTLWHSYVSSLIARRTLQRQHLIALQSRLFPIYFTAQGVLSGVALLTSSNQTSQIIFGITTVSSLINRFIVGPWVFKVMAERAKVEADEGKQYNDPDISEKLRSMNKKFARAHGVSVLFNLGIAIMLVFYPFASPSLKI